jgi:hypothetical protein
MRKLLQLTFAILLAASGGLMAQGVTSATIIGKVVGIKSETNAERKSTSDEGLPGANVVAVHVPSGTAYGTSTRPDGRFSIPNLRVGGPYKITVSFVGYDTKEKTDIMLGLGNEISLDFRLAESGTQLAEIVVSGVQDPILSADRTGIATNITRAQLTQLPTLSRSFADFTRLTPQSNGLSFGGRSSSFNNITIDGALFNNSFGLSSTVGGQTSAQPISLDSFEEIQVNIAPFDVRQGSFTGASINAVTRSGTNDFSGSVYTYIRNQNTIGYKIGTTEIPKSDFSNKQTGFRVGGPIIKNKLFFFVNGEMERGEKPSSPWSAARPGLTPDGTTISRAQASDLDALSTFLSTKYGYNTGPYENFPLKNTSDKFTVKLDYNINSNHRVNIKYNYLKSYSDITPSSSGGGLTGARSPGASGMPYYAAFYGINNNLNSVIAELNSVFGTKFSNTFNIGYSAFRDFRSSPGGIFPLVDIGDGSSPVTAGNASGGTSGSSYFTSFGYEPFTANNLLNTDVFQATDNFTAYMGAHTITGGASIETYKFKNGFAQQYYGQYRYNSLQDFYNDADPATTNNAGASAVNYQLRYSALPGGEFPWARLNAAQVSVYVQDQWSTLNDKLKLTVGLRGDLPIYGTTTGPANPSAEALTFRDGEQIDVSKLPQAKLLYSPRVGFNYDVFGNRKTTIRGGTGIFTGRVPFVWLSNQLSNNGVIFGTLNINQAGTAGTPTTASYPFNPDVTAYIPATATLPSTYALNSSVTNYKIAQVYRTNLGVDQVLPGGVVLTLEAMLTKELNNAYLRDANLKNPVGTLSDGRAYFSTIGATGAYVANSYRINPTVTNALVQTNTNKGYSYALTVQARKRFKNLDASLAYNYGKAKDVNSGGSTAGGIYGGRPIVDDPNAAFASLSDFNLTHRLIGSVNYSVDYAKNFRTTLGLFMTANSGFHYSYTYSSDLNGDGQTNDLIYIPETAADIKLAPVNAADTRTPAQLWSQLDAFIAQDPYLSKHRGAFAERNGARTPGNVKFDTRILQDFYVDVKGKRNTIQLSLDIFNVSNLIDPNWGVTKQINSSRNQLLGISSITTAGVPTFTFPLQNAATLTPLTNSFSNNTGLGSRWQMQFGVRYIFN